MTVRARWGCDPRTALPHGVDVLGGEGDLWLLDDPSGRLGLLTDSDLIRIREAASDSDKAANERAKHDGIENRDCRRVRDITNEEPPPGRRRCMMSEQYCCDRGNACQEDKGQPEQPVRAAKGYRPSHAHVN